MLMKFFIAFVFSEMLLCSVGEVAAADPAVCTDFQPVLVPEASTLILLGIGLLVCARLLRKGWRRR